MPIETDFDVPFVSRLALREKQIQQHYRPVIAVHKWFARRPGTLFRSLLLSEFNGSALRQKFYESHDLAGLQIGDPFMGGGTPLIEANRLGCDVVGWDINPMAHWIVSREIEHVDLDAYRKAADRLVMMLENEVGEQYRTRCVACDAADARVKYFLWVKTALCGNCQGQVDLFPGYLIARAGRHPRHVLLCRGCGELNEIDDLDRPGTCSTCSLRLSVSGPARRGKIECPRCAADVHFPMQDAGPPRERLFAIEYHCERCKLNRRGRFFKKPDATDIGRFDTAVARWRDLQPRFVPDESIPAGDESTRLHRWGYRHYRDLFNERQLLGLELSARWIGAREDGRIRRALATNFSDLLRYNNMLVRYDTAALKALDIFSVHGFPVGLVRCESNLLGIRNSDGRPVGSGGWANITDKYTKAKAYCERPFEVRPDTRRKVYVTDEWIGDQRAADAGGTRKVDLRCGSATAADLPAQSLDAVFTDPPYFDSVQYAELMDFCYVWLRKLTGTGERFGRSSTRHEDELTGNATAERGLEHFAEGLSNVFRRMAAALKPGAPLAFTYHHNRLEAYGPIAVAILDAGLFCSAALPCPAEMGGSIHINGTGSSIVDTVFVCRAAHSGETDSSPSIDTIAARVSEDLANLVLGGLQPTPGDVRCLIFGHVTRYAIGQLGSSWDSEITTMDRLERVGRQLDRAGDIEAIRDRVTLPKRAAARQHELFPASA